VIQERRRSRTLGLLAVAVVACLVGLLAHATGTRSLELETVDLRFDLRGAEHDPPEVAVVGIDAKTLSAAGTFPFSRTWHARVIDRLDGAGARAVAYDVEFVEQSDDLDADNALVTAVANSRATVLAATETDDDGEPNVFGGGGVVESIGARAGSVQFPADDDGVIRRMPAQAEGLGSFAIKAAELATTRSPHPAGQPRPRLEPPPGESMWIDFTGPPGSVRSASFVDVLRGRFPKNFFRGRIVVVGATAPSLKDTFFTATSGEEVMSGAELNAHAIVTALRGYELREPSSLVDGLIVVLLGALAPLTALLGGPRRALFVAPVAVPLLMVGAYVAFDQGWILPVVSPLIAWLLGIVGVVIIGAVTNAIERQRVHDVFSRFVGQQVVDEVLSCADGARLRAVQVYGTILFCDLRGFTTYSERHPAPVVLEALNHYLTLMSEAILDAGGTLTAYLGDGIMALFGAPITYEDHADRALAAADEMLRRLPAFNAWLRENGHEGPFDMGIGLCTGPVMSGNVGSERRLEYTAIGDTVNTASRLEGLTKGTPHQLFLSDATRRALLRPPPRELQEIGELEVRGRGERVLVWTFAGVPGSEPVVVRVAGDGERPGEGEPRDQQAAGVADPGLPPA